MNYTYPPEEYARQLRAYHEMEKLTFSPEDSKEYILEKLEERSAKKRVVADIANTMIREYIETFEKDPDAVTAEDIEKLKEFTAALHNGGFDTEIPDPAIMLRLTRIRKRYYEQVGDRVMEVSGAAMCLCYYMMLFGMHSVTYAGTPYAEEVLAMKDRYSSLPFTQRQQILASLNYSTAVQAAGFGNPEFSLERIWRCCDTMQELIRDEYAIDAVERPQELQGAPENWAEASLQACLGQAIDSVNGYCDYQNAMGKPLDMEDIKRHALPLIDKMRSDMKNGTWYFVKKELAQVTILMVEFHFGDITLEEFFAKLNELREHILTLPPIEQITLLADIDFIYLKYIYQYSGFATEKIAQICQERLKEALPRVLQVTRQVSNIHFNTIPMKYITAASYAGRFADFANVVLELTIYADKPLFIHTAMVRELSRAIFDCMIERQPEFFDGVAGFDVAYIREHTAEIRALLDDCCMYHDLGKFWMTDITGNSMRRLTDDEFKLIKEHPHHFEEVCAHINEG
ncbi:MAG: hypothetical protein IKS68_01395, partial [Mailhella sp.]|nr:hypothetical protein [Mailhella sp.]